MPVIAINYQAETSSTALGLVLLIKESLLGEAEKEGARRRGMALIANWRLRCGYSCTIDDSLMLNRLLTQISHPPELSTGKPDVVERWHVNQVEQYSEKVQRQFEQYMSRLKAMR